MQGVKLAIHPFDLAIIVFYLVGIVGLGCWAGMRQRRKIEGKGYFLADKSIGQIASLEKLRTLSLSGVDYATDHGIELLAALGTNCHGNGQVFSITAGAAFERLLS